MFELNELPKQKVKIYGKEYEITKPTVRQLKTVQKKIEDNKGNLTEGSDEMIKFIAQLGIPEDVVEGLPAEHFNLLVEHLVGAKKN